MNTTLDKNEILSRLNYAAFWESELQGRIVSRSGVNWLCRSPFRADRHPSFSVNVQTGVFNDFADEQLRGDVIAYVEKRYGMDFKQALEYLAGGNPAPCRPKAEPVKVRTIRQGVRADYILREIVTGSLTNRGNIKPCEALPDYFDRPGTREAYHSVYLHTPDIVEYYKTHFKEEKNTLAGYSGPVWCTELTFDVDHKGGTIQENIGNSLAGIKALITRLKSFGLSSFDIACTGNKGFTVTVSTPLLDKLSGYTDTPTNKEVKEGPGRVETLVRKLAGDIPGLDYSIYGTTHLVRSLNSINGKSGLYKIPLTEAEIYTLSPEQIINLAKNPRKLEINVPLTKVYSRLFDEQFTIDENGNVVFASGVTFDRKEINMLRGEKDKQAIKALYNIKKHFGGTVEKE
jgi:DNA primase (bacterial type)